MRFAGRLKVATYFFCATLALGLLATKSLAQTEDLGDGDADPVKLFERGQAAHARGDLEKALALYEEAIKVRPEFPEAAFQQGVVLVSLGRLADAETSYRKAIELRQNWSLPYSALGALLVRTNRDSDASPVLQQALKLDSRDNVALRLLADLRLRVGDADGALKLAQTATIDPDAPASAWILRAMAERAKGDKQAARNSLDHVLEVEPTNTSALLERAELCLASNEYECAIDSLSAAERIKIGDKQILSRLAVVYERAGKPEEAKRISASAGLEATQPTGSAGGIVGTVEEIEAANSEDPAKARKGLEKLLEKNPRSAMLLARLGASYRIDSPDRSVDFYRRASELQPDNHEYATGYASALIRSGRFADAVALLRHVIAAAPDHYTAHANLATALYKLKRYPDALLEYEWLLKTRPNLSIAHYFIATAYDNLGEYKEALAAYETFLGKADATTNQLEIEKVKLRLPSLRHQIQIGQGVKRKP